MIFDKRILGVCFAASKDDVRPILSGVQVKNGYAVATDGMILIRVKLPTVDPKDLPNVDGTSFQEIQEIVLPAQDVADIAKSIRGKKKKLIDGQYGWTIERKDGRVKMVTAVSANSTVKFVATNEITGEYPKVDKVIDPAVKNPPKATVRLNIDLLRNLLNGLSKTGAPYVDIKVGESSQAVIITSEDAAGDEVLGLIMPMHVPNL